MANTNFVGVEDTLFIPLAARVLGSRRFPHYFMDQTALSFENNEQVKAINAKSSEYTMMASVARYHNMDEMVLSFLSKNKNASVVNLGVGLETMNVRLQNSGGHFYQVDFPKVIQMRERVLGKQSNETLIACDITDMAWTNKVPKDKPILLVASGVFQYFKSEHVHDFLMNMKKHLNHPQLIFDATNHVGIAYATKYVKKTGNQSAMMYFFIDDPDGFCHQKQIKLLELRTFFTSTRKQCKPLSLYTRIAMKVVDDQKRAIILHVAL